MIAVVALVAWCVEFASHLHVSHEAQVSTQGSHFCDMCAAFQAGTSVDPTSPTIPKLRPALIEAIFSTDVPRQQLTYSYRSRAPPHF